MRLLIFFLLVVSANLNLHAQATKNVTISGKIFRPTDTLVLLKPFEDVRYQGTKIPVSADSTFSHSFSVGVIEEYQLVFLSDFKNGGWRPVNFFTDTDQITFKLFSLDQAANNETHGSEFTDRKNEFMKGLEELWYPEYIKLQEQAKSGVSDSRLKILNDSLVAEMIIWKHETLMDYPDEIGLSNHYDDLNNYQGDIDLLHPVLKRHNEYWLSKPRINSTSDVIADLYFTKVEKILGKKFTDFYLLDSKGDSSLLSKEITDDGFILLDLWSPWCGPCIYKSKLVVEDLDKLRANSVTVIGVMGGIPTMEKFAMDMERFKYPWSVYPEVKDKQSIWQKYGYSNAGGGQVLINGSGVVIAIDPSVDEILALTNK